LQEFTELGSGFNLAMRDLEIRGAGNLLGAEQSGFIMEMGLEMYQRIVEEAVTELKHQEFELLFEGKKEDARREKVETVIETDIEAFIPDFFIESDAERLDFYRRLYKARSREEIQLMREELRDRFGQYPEEVENLFSLIELKIAAAAIGFKELELQKGELTLHFPLPDHKEFYEGVEGKTAAFQSIMTRIGELKPYHAKLKQEGKQLKLLLSLDAAKESSTRIAQTRDLLTRIGDLAKGFAKASKDERILT
jgi:transcription-repair coupling factor (superfamily II helicase)